MGSNQPSSDQKSSTLPLDYCTRAWRHLWRWFKLRLTSVQRRRVHSKFSFNILYVSDPICCTHIDTHMYSVEISSVITYVSDQDYSRLDQADTKPNLISLRHTKSHAPKWLCQIMWQVRWHVVMACAISSQWKSFIIFNKHMCTICWSVFVYETDAVIQAPNLNHSIFMGLI